MVKPLCCKQCRLLWLQTSFCWEELKIAKIIVLFTIYTLQSVQLIWLVGVAGGARWLHLCFWSACCTTLRQACLSILIYSNTYKYWDGNGPAAEGRKDPCFKKRQCLCKCFEVKKKAKICSSRQDERVGILVGFSARIAIASELAGLDSIAVFVDIVVEFDKYFWKIFCWLRQILLTNRNKNLTMRCAGLSISLKLQSQIHM